MDRTQEFCGHVQSYGGGQTAVQVPRPWTGGATYPAAALRQHAGLIEEASVLAREVRDMAGAIATVLRKRRSRMRLISAAMGTAAAAAHEMEDQEAFKQCRSFCDSVSKRLDKMRAECDGARPPPTLASTQLTIVGILFKRVEELVAAIETEKQHSLTRTMNQIRSARLQAHGVDHGPHEGSDTGGGVRRRRPQQRPQQRQEQPDRGAAPAASAALAAQEGEDSEATALLSGLSEEERQVLAQENRDLSERLNKEAEDVRNVERSMAEISSLIREMTSHAEEQDAKIRTVEDNAQDTFDNVTSANDNLEQAAQHSARFRVCILAFLVAAGLLLLLLDALS